ncbi:phosphatase and actin regulator 2 isoform X1 [Paramormyrops kingsleyae]|uniref:phosphatase and actin regulator 2 isoform X1 n=1 Tax=Paramormyrops kingsleyae TaxID=1676925 RepID=UPI003B9783F0
MASEPQPGGRKQPPLFPLQRVRSQSDTSCFRARIFGRLHAACSVDGLEKPSLANSDVVVGGTGAQTPPLKQKGKLSSLGKIFKPWKWRKKKTSEKFQDLSKVLERKISMRQSREELIRRGVLIPDQDEQVNCETSNGHTAPVTVETAPPEEAAPDSAAEKAGSPAPCEEDDRTERKQGKPDPKVAQCRSRDGLAKKGQAAPPKAPSGAAGGVARKDAACGDKKGGKSGGKQTPTPKGNPRNSNRGNAKPTQAKKSAGASKGPPQSGPVSGPSGGAHRQPKDTDGTGLRKKGGRRAEDPSGTTKTPARAKAVPGDDGAANQKPRPAAGEEPAKEGQSAQSGSKVNQDVEDAASVTDSQNEKFYNCLEEQPGPDEDGGVASESSKTHPVPEGAHPPAGGDVKLQARITDAPPETIPSDSRESQISDSDSDRSTLYRSEEDEEEEDDEDEHSSSSLASKIRRRDTLAIKLGNRPSKRELEEKNILPRTSMSERQELRQQIGCKLVRRLSQRPTTEELEQRNILKQKNEEEEQEAKQEIKRRLSRKLSVRPTVAELVARRILRFNEYVEVTDAKDYDRRADKPWTRLTPADKAAIRKELNEFKSKEMEVHEDSKHFTRFHRP